MSRQPFFTTGTYKGKPYRVLWIGRTKYGFRAHLEFMNGSKDFWCDGNLVMFNGRPASDQDTDRTTDRREPQPQPIVEPQPVQSVPQDARPVNRPYPLPAPREITTTAPTAPSPSPAANPTRQPAAYANLTQMLINAARGQRGE